MSRRSLVKLNGGSAAGHPVAVVTGSSGFIGRHLVQWLTESGWQVECLIRPDSADQPIPGASRKVADLSGPIDPAVLRGADAVFHLGGVTRAVSDRSFWRGNVEPTSALLAATAREAPHARFVYFSSQAAAGPASSAHHPITEASPAHPIEVYGRSKLAAEALVRAAPVPWTILRPASVFGRGDRDFAMLFRQIRLGAALYATDPEGLVSVIHVSDVVRAAVEAATHRAAVGETYFLTSEPPRSWRELYRAAAQTSGHDPVELRVPRPVVAVAALVGDLAGWISGRPALINSRKLQLAVPRYWICSGARAAEQLGFRARVTVEEGFRDYVPAAGTG
jgi:nucleoside-diphosphate-sugar epimerase